MRQVVALAGGFRERVDLPCDLREFARTLRVDQHVAGVVAAVERGHDHRPNREERRARRSTAVDRDQPGWPGARRARPRTRWPRAQPATTAARIRLRRQPPGMKAIIARPPAETMATLASIGASFAAAGLSFQASQACCTVRPRARRPAARGGCCSRASSPRPRRAREHADQPEHQEARERVAPDHRPPRSADAQRERQELVRRHQHVVVEPGLVAARDVLLRLPVVERAPRAAEIRPSGSSRTRSSA